MAENTTVNDTIIKGKYPHIEWLDLGQNGVLVECAIMKREKNGDVYFFSLEQIDQIDKARLARIIRGRNAEMFDLYDLMSQVTLGNGVNALIYFQQLAKVRTASGQIFPASASRHGMPSLQVSRTLDEATGQLKTQ